MDLTPGRALLLSRTRPVIVAAGAVADHVWTPDATTRAAGERAAVPYRIADVSLLGQNDAPVPAIVALAAGLRTAPGVTSVGMRRDSARLPGGLRDPHVWGWAADAMIASGASRAANGDALANYLVRNAAMLGLQYVLWSHYEWSASGSGPRWESHAAGDHQDHVHVELSPEARAWSADTMRSRWDAALAASAPSRAGTVVAAGVGAALAAGLAYAVFGGK